MEEIYISLASDKIRISNILKATQGLKDALIALGAATDEEDYLIKAPSNEDKALIFSKLRDLGICFIGGAGWSPSALFEEFRAQGLISGVFKEIQWTKPDHYNVIEK